MINKKLLTLILVILAIVVCIVIFATVFTLRNVDLVYHNTNGDMIALPSDSMTGNDVLDLVGRRNIIFLSKSDAVDKLNTRYPKYHAIAIIKSFPSTITVHLVERSAVYFLDVNGGIYIDSFGYVVESTTSEVVRLNVEVFPSGVAGTQTVGAKLKLNSTADSPRLDALLNTISAIWQVNYAYSDIPKILHRIEFSAEPLKLVITTSAGATINVDAPEKNLSERLINALSVYFNSELDLQKSGVVINVSESGTIFTPK
jgi:cell division septal protein FtsQ